MNHSLPSTVSVHDLTDAETIPRDLLARTEADLTSYVEQVGPIIKAVRLDGDEALLRFARQYDSVTAASFPLRATEFEFDEAFARVDPQVIEAIKYGAQNIRAFHEAQKPEEMWLKEIQPGAFAGDRFVPIDSVACYVPRGKGSFPSVVLMTAIPAVVAGVPRRIIVTPPGPDGKVDSATLVAARLVGIDEVYKCGGAQGVAAVAYGTATVPKCLKIVGPGSPWVVAAKRLLADVIDPGVPAGPSECVILADESASGALAALDLIIESEHGPDSSAFLVTNSQRVVDEAREAIPRFWAQMIESRARFSRTVLGGLHGGIVLTRDFDAAIQFVNEYGPEHLEVLTDDPFGTLGKIRNAGEILLGNYTPVTLGNFVLGPNAVLPTGGAARTASPLSVFDYMKRVSVGYVTKGGYAQLASRARQLATYEGFDGHARAVSPLRLELLKV
ncbi:histidinol dehydrogenase [Paraburkholderia fungorum]|uniref:histidinol dehydrogenase n=1 Tax=Paraburkholderia fungorum TaxID=134537 RepID=UPI00402B4E29